MALVKKLNPGGTIDYTKLATDADELISSLNVKGKDQRKVREELAKMVGFIQKEGNSFTLNPISKQYTFTGQGADQFTGSTEDIDTNLLGNYKIKDDTQVRSIAAGLLDQAMSRQTIGTKPQNVASTQKIDATMPSLEQGIKNIYRNPAVWEASKKEIKDEQSWKNLLTDVTSKIVNEYKTSAQKEPNLNYIDLDKVANVEAAIASKDWGALKESVKGLGWVLEDFKNPELDPVVQRQTLVDKYKTTREALIKRGLNPDLYLGVDNAENPTALTGFYETADEWIPQGAGTWFRDIVKANNLQIQYDPTKNAHIVLKEGIPFDFKVMSGPGRGYSWKNTAKGFKLFNPTYAQTEFLNTYKGTPGSYQQLNTGVLSPEYKGYSVWADNSNKLLLYNPATQSRAWAHRTGNQFIDEKGRPVQLSPIIGTFNKFTSFNPTGEFIQPYETKSSELNTLLQNTNTILQRVPKEQGYFDFSKNINAESISALKTYAGKLKYLLNSGAVPENQKAQVRQIIENVQNGFLGLGDKGNVYLKQYQQGGSLEQRIKAARQKRVNPTPSEKNTTKPAYFETLMGDTASNNVKTALLAGSVFAPGIVGAGAGLGYTVLDAIDSAKDGSFDAKDWANLALNLGFSGASFIGLGGLRGAKVLGKLGNLQKTVSVGKLANRVDKFEKIDKVDDSLKTIKEFVKTKGAEEATTSLKTLKQLATAENKVDVVKAIDTAEDFYKQTKVIALPNLGKTIRNTSIGLTAASGITNLGGAGEGLKTLVTDPSNVTTDQLESILKVAGASRLGIRGVSHAVGKKWGTVPTSKTDAELTIKGEKVTDKSLINKFEAAKKNPISKAKFIKEYNKGKADDAKITKKDVEYTEASTSGKELRMKASLDKNLFMQNWGMKAAKKYNLAPAPAPQPVTPPTPPTPDKFDFKTIKSSDFKSSRLVELSKASEMKNKRAAIQEVWNQRKVNPADSTPLKSTEKAPKVPRVHREPSLEESKKLVKQLSKIKKFTNSREKLRVEQTIANLNKKIAEQTSQGEIQFNKAGGILKGQSGLGIIGKKNLKGYMTDFIKELPNKVDAVDVSNTAMLAKTLDTNKKAFAAQQKAAAVVPRMSTMSSINIKQTTPYSLAAQGQINTLQNQAYKLGKATSDLDKYLGVQLSANSQIGDIRTKAMQMDQQRNDQLAAQQLQSDANVKKYNLQVADKNAANVAAAEQKIHLLAANKLLSDNTAINNWLLARDRNMQYKESKAAGKALWDEYSSPEYTGAYKEYETAFSPESENEVKTAFDKIIKDPTRNVNLTLEDYEPYKELLSKRKLATEKWKAAQQKIGSLNLQYSLIGSKAKGGSLSKEDRIEIDKAKSNNKRKEKDLEYIYKSILKNNELLQKALLKIWK